MENGNTANNENEMGNGKPIGPPIGTIIIVLVLIIGAFYFWGSKLEKTTSPAIDENMTAEEVLAKPDVSLDALQTQGTSDEIGAIEQDINATDLQNLNTESSKIDAELAI